MIYSEEALVLRCIDYSNTSQILHLFTSEQGKISLMAKGAKRQSKSNLSGGMELLNHVSLVYYQKSRELLAVLKEWELKDHFPLLRRDLGKLFFAQYWAELVTEGSEDYEANLPLFTLVCRSLRQMSATNTPHSLFFIVTWQILGHLGIAPHIISCLRCQTPLGGEQSNKTILFAPQHGGVFCHLCQRYAKGMAVQMHATAIGKMSSLIAAPAAWETVLLSPQEHHELNSLFRFHLQHAWHKDLRLARYVDFHR